MRTLEIILKILFLIGSILSIKMESVSHTFLIAYLLICLILGFVLIFNKKSSYRFAQAKKDYIMRRIEGSVLIAFSVFVACAQLF